VILPLCLALLGASAPAGAVPAPERVVFHTAAGDLAFELFPKAAPKTVAQFLGLVRAGVYDGTQFSRIRPGFMVQVSSAGNRTAPLTTAQAGLIRRLPIEASELKHERGVLSMTRKENDPDSAESSFCILLGPAPQLDGKYTAFGRVVAGEEVLDRLAQIPHDDRMRASVRVGVSRAEVVPTAQALAALHLEAAHPIPGVPTPVAPIAAPARPPPAASAMLRAAAVPASNPPGQKRKVWFLSAGLLAIALLGAAKVLFAKRLAIRHMASLDLVAVLISAFLLLVLLIPEGQRLPWLAGVLFVGLIAVLRLLGRFEAPVQRS
jgi:peptidyl-prolyl cis-trans isomerase B (cyclophilin B)